MPTNKGWEMRLIGEYQPDEVVSSLQKMCRRGKEYEACYWGFILHQSGYGEYLWRRLSIICSEDVGNGNPQASMLLDSLRNSWERLHKRIKEPTLDKFLFITQIVLYLCRSPKTRENDSLSNLINEHWQQGVRLPVPTIGKDSHTNSGRKKWGKFGAKDGKEKLRLDKWFSYWALITNKAYPDKWKGELKNLWLEKAGENVK